MPLPFRVLVPALLGATILCTAAKADPLYAVTDLPSAFKAVGINDSGQIAGTAQYGTSSQYAAVWSNGALLDLGEGVSQAGGINNSGAVTGVSSTSSGFPAFVWQNGTTTILPPATSSFPRVIPVGINDSGAVAGSSLYPAYWNASGTPTILTSPSTVSATAVALNDAGTVIGNFYDPQSNVTTAVSWNGPTGAYQVLSGLAGSTDTAAEAINNTGLIAGISTAAGATDLVQWDDGQLQNLATLSGGAQVVGINNSDEIVGNSGGSGFLWSTATGLISLNSLFASDNQLHIQSVLGLNDLGQIIVAGFDGSFNGDILLTLGGAPVDVPEPASIALLATAFAGLVVLRGRWNKVNRQQAAV